MNADRNTVPFECCPAWQMCQFDFASANVPSNMLKCPSSLTGRNAGQNTVPYNRIPIPSKWSCFCSILCVLLRVKRIERGVEHCGQMICLCEY